MAHLRPLTEADRFDEVAGQLTRPKLRHLRVCELRAEVARPPRYRGTTKQIRTLTLRLEQRDGAWLCTHFEVL